MRFIIDYDIVRGTTAGDIVDGIRAKINEAGWQPFGKLMTSPDGGYLQPIVRYAGPASDGRIHFPSDD